MPELQARNGFLSMSPTFRGGPTDFSTLSFRPSFRLDVAVMTLIFNVFAIRHIRNWAACRGPSRDGAARRAWGGVGLERGPMAKSDGSWGSTGARPAQPAISGIASASLSPEQVKNLLGRILLPSAQLAKCLHFHNHALPRQNIVKPVVVMRPPQSEGAGAAAYDLTEVLLSIFALLMQDPPELHVQVCGMRRFAFSEGREACRRRRMARVQPEIRSRECTPSRAKCTLLNCSGSVLGTPALWPCKGGGGWGDGQGLPSIRLARLPAASSCSFRRAPSGRSRCSSFSSIWSRLARATTKVRHCCSPRFAQRMHFFRI